MRHQRGTSYLAIMLAVVGFAFMAKVAIAVWGPYFEDRMINSQIREQLVSAPKNISPAGFVKEMDKRFNMNMIDIKFSDIAQVNNDNGLRVEKNYEIRKPFLLNIDIVLKFEKSFDQSSVQAK
ncbi:DUF4845 domain-containing protein [Acinetobacter sp. ANC 4945]|uniref:DUF4845 domain-containing protein n=1 Tax=Acinetobacter amyesii TaxID=2942470 RepID=A0A1T1GYF7_9GAMM|nr:MULTISPECIES: DUF4845 domain-containing protein [Acinetobacter]MCL6246699.1 DUF4845 domain-containing protein [Acinetobacter amyesii]OOV82649.1 DUF4845 domain-containing protein [Acinetobacter amyesii]